ELPTTDGAVRADGARDAVGLRGTRGERARPLGRGGVTQAGEVAAQQLADHGPAGQDGELGAHGGRLLNWKLRRERRQCYSARIPSSSGGRRPSDRSGSSAGELAAHQGAARLGERVARLHDLARVPYTSTAVKPPWRGRTRTRRLPRIVPAARPEARGGQRRAQP